MKIISCLFIGLLLISFVTPVSAEWVSGYYKKTGTYVNPYYRSDRGYSQYRTSSSPYLSPTYYSTYSRSYSMPALPAYGSKGSYTSSVLGAYEN